MRALVSNIRTRKASSGELNRSQPLYLSVFGATTAASYTFSGLVDWSVAGLFVLGGLTGGVAGVQIGHLLARRKRALNVTFASLVILVGFYIVFRGFLVLSARA